MAKMVGYEGQVYDFEESESGSGSKSSDKVLKDKKEG